MEFAGLIALVLLFAFREWQHAEDRRESAALIRDLDQTNARQLEETRGQVSEMATRIQHPELYRPDIDPTREMEVPGPVFDDEFHLTGKVVAGEENGDGER